MASETVTVLFTDLVGSTELLSRVGPEQAEALRVEHFALLRDAVDTHGGREVKNLGDGLMVAFGAVSAALETAVAMQQGFEARNRGADEPMEIRVGISTGEADVDGDDYFGTPVVEASRLCDRCDGGEILVSGLVTALLGSRGGHRFESLGDVELKGLDGPLSTERVVWEPLEGGSADGFAFPARLVRAEDALFVGRVEERSLIADALKAAQTDGHRRIVLVGGEPGIGKTTLVSAASAAAREQGVIVAYGRCDEDLSIPYQPWREAIGHLVDQGVVPREAVAALLGTNALADDVTDAEGARFELFRSTLRALTHAASDRPVLLVLDDLHWADGPTVALLRRIAGTSDPMPVVVIATFRDAEITTDHPMADALAALHREDGVDRVNLVGFDDLEVLDALETLAGHEMDERGLALRDALRAETGGNPFFITEILRHLTETGAIVRTDEGQWVGTADIAIQGLPVSVREVVGRRIANLGEDTQRVLRHAAVIGRDFDLELLADTTDLDTDDLLDLLEPVETLGLISATGPDGFTFSHALIAHTLYDELSGPRRARAHRAVAEALEAALGDDPGERTAEIAHHWAEATTPRDADKAVDSARRAGDYALANHAPDEALRWYRRGLEFLDAVPEPSADRQLPLLVGVGRAQRQIGDGGYLDTLLRAGDLASESGDDDALVSAALATNRGLASSIGQTVGPTVELLERAFAVVEGTDTPLEARLTACLASELQYDGSERADHLAVTAIDIARRTGDDATIAFTGPIAATIARSTPRLAEVRTWALEAVEAADRIGNDALLMRALPVVLWAALERGTSDEIDDALDRLRDTAERAGLPLNDWGFAVNQVAPVLLRGDTVAAETLATRALELGSAANQPDAMVMYVAQLNAFRRQQGRLHEIDDLLTGAVAANPALNGLRQVLATLRVRQGRLDEAAELIAADVAGGFSFPATDVAWSTAVLLLAEVIATMELAEPAAVLYEVIEPYAEHRPCTTLTIDEALHVPLGRLASLLGRFDDAEAHFARAEEIHASLGARCFLARTHAAWAEMLERRGDPDRARAMADRALGVAVDAGYGYVEADARAVLERLGEAAS